MFKKIKQINTKDFREHIRNFAHPNLESTNTATEVAPKSPTANDIFYYRYQHGTNLGSIYALERWLTGSIYPSCTAGDGELDAVKASLSTDGLPTTRTRWENHWSTAITDEEFHWLVSTAHCNMLRLPIGWFTLGPSFCAGTAFDGDPAQVYIGAWASIKKLVQRAHDHGIGVLIDLHGLPGGANGETHSGTSTGKAELWDNAFNLSLAQRCLVFVAQEAYSMPGVVGVQLCNEANWDPPGMYEWYDRVISAIGAVNCEIPVYISDGWDFARAIGYTQVKNRGSNPIVIDTHKYYCFTEADTAQSAGQITARVAQELGELDGNVFDHGAASAFVGEYSCALAESTWAQGGDRSGLTRAFGQAQSRRWQGRAGGSAFWTLKMDWMDGGDWGFKQQTNDGAIVPPHSLMLLARQVEDACAGAEVRRMALHDEAYNAHVQYWNQTSQGQGWEHKRYSDGWNLGWSDAEAFFRARADGVVPGGDGGDKIGLLDLWVRKRMVETGQAKERTVFGWEWEHGFRKGVADLESAVGI